MPSQRKPFHNRQAVLCVEVAQQAVKASQSGTPADKTLANIFRSRRELGSRDRRLLQQVIFAMFRWWGWVAQWCETSWDKTLLIAYLLDGNPWTPICEKWAQMDQLPVLPNDWTSPSSVPHKRQWLSDYLNLPLDTFLAAQLVPKHFDQFSNIAQASPQFKQTLLFSLQTRPPVWIRSQKSTSINLKSKLLESHVTILPHPYLHQAGEIQGPFNIHEIQAYKQGLFEIQDLASQCIGLVCHPETKEHWWDACAGGGGKTMHLAALLNNTGQILATDIRQNKLNEIRRRAKRGNWQNIQIAYWNGEKPLQNTPLFDGVLVDAPCSGTGTWRRNPDARWRLDDATIKEKTNLQYQILENAQRSVKKGGVLVYATCSLMEIENERVIEYFLEQHPHFTLDPVSHPITQENTLGMLTIWPHEFNSDGMFIARMRKQS